MKMIELAEKEKPQFNDRLFKHKHSSDGHSALQVVITPINPNGGFHPKRSCVENGLLHNGVLLAPVKPG